MRIRIRGSGEPVLGLGAAAGQALAEGGVGREWGGVFLEMNS